MSVNHPEVNGSPSTKVKVVIVGAGIAGVTAAAKLLHNGVTDLVILEAQDYVGGRIKADVVDGKKIDYGAQYIHGQVGNPLYSIAKKLGILDEDTDSDIDSINDNSAFGSSFQVFFCSNGERLTDEEVKSCVTFVEEQYTLTDPDSLEEEGSIEEIFAKAFQRFTDNHKGEISPRLKQLLDASYRNVCSQMAIDNAAFDLKDISAWASLKYKEMEGDRYTQIHGGMTEIYNSIVRLLPEQTIHTNSPVTSIEWSTEDDSKQTSIVTCDGGRRYEADYVIITISSACLANGLSMFEPPLPSSFTKALSGMKLGLIGKVFLEWESPVWDLEESIAFLWLESSPITVKSDKTKKLTRFGRPWWEGVVGCETIPSHENMLELFFCGDQVEILEELDDEEVKSVLHEILQVFFNNPSLPSPVGIYRSMWLSNPYVRGTYTYATTSFRRSDMDTLSTPLPSMEKPRIQFAGEAYSLAGLGAAHGAFTSGEDKANIILKSLGNETDNEWKSVIQLVQKA